MIGASDRMTVRLRQLFVCCLAVLAPLFLVRTASAQAVTGTTALAGLTGVALLSNGASRFVDPYGVGTWGDAVGLLRTRGPDELLRQVHGVEASASG